jgi:CPA1 family monovalent cation:H+ antiporter
LIWYGVAVSLAVILARFVWICTAFPVSRLLDRFLGGHFTDNGWRGAFIVGWAGMRGGISLAAALAIPDIIADGSPLPERDLVIFLTFCVILATLIVQGLSLRPLIRLLGIPEDRETRQEIKTARWEATQASLKRLEELKQEHWVPQDYAERLRYYFERKLYGIATYTEGVEEKRVMEHFSNYQRLRYELLQAERAAIIQLRNNSIIGDEALWEVERAMDLEEQRLKV